ncbi:MAG TPA: FAD-dependent oxidoreductase [Gemmatimonadales bacterium]|nr:FAD-dependent oxidoreductase [Gemmatimonadales bacterium]
MGRVRRFGSLTDELKPALADMQVTVEAGRCLECGGPLASPPCTLACPAGVDVPGFVGAIVRGDLAGAASTIFAANILGGSCARVCPVEELCEGACVLARAGRYPVRIGRLQRYAMDWALAQSPEPQGRVPNGRHVAVIGAGPAGLACAAELAALGYAVTVYEAREASGGLIRYAIAPYRQIADPLPQEFERIAALGVRFVMGFAVDRPERLLQIENGADAVFLGVGLGKDLDGGYGGADLPGVWPSLEFIEQLKTGTPPAVGRRVAVIGCGNTAIDAAREALRLGAAHVSILYRRTQAEMPAYAHEYREAVEEGVEFRWLTNPVRFVGRGRLRGVECERMRLGAPDASGRARPEPIPGSTITIPVDTAIVAIGQVPRAEFLGWIPGLALDRGKIRIDPATGRTANPKYFAGGDAVNGGATAVAAVGAGKRAAWGIHRALSGLPTEVPAPPPATAPPVEAGPVWRYEQADAALIVNRMWCKACDLCVEVCPTGILALDASERITVSDISRCIFCGLCALRCPDYVFVLERAGAPLADSTAAVLGDLHDT